MSENEIPTEVIKLIINTLSSNAITPEEQQFGHFIHNKLQHETNQSVYVSRNVWETEALGYSTKGCYYFN